MMPPELARWSRREVGSGPEKLSVVNVTRAKVCVRRKRQLNGPKIVRRRHTHHCCPTRL